VLWRLTDGRLSGIYLELDVNPMGRKSHKNLAGMAELGARLRQLRKKAGLSQMKLAEQMGFVPNHGYKYVFRLEKGTVPNPTLRTISSYLDACSASWHEIADLLPTSRKQPAGESAKKPRPREVVVERKSEPVRRSHRDRIPQRQRLRAELLARRSEHARAFWTRFEQVENRAVTLLNNLGVPGQQQRLYISFLRSCCLAIDAHAGSRPAQLDKEIAQMLKSAGGTGLSEEVLLALRDLCPECIAPPGGNEP